MKTIDSEILKDSRYVDMLGIPSDFRFYDFDAIYYRPFELKELAIIHQGLILKSVQHIIRAVQLVVSCDLNELTDGDFLFVMAYLRVYSYPNAPMTSNWTCNSEVIEDKNDQYVHNETIEKMSDAKLARLGYTRSVCGHENVSLVHGYKISHVMLPEKLKIPEYLILPRVGTLVEAEELLEEPKYKNIVGKLRYIKSGTTLLDKLKWLKARPNKMALILSQISKLQKSSIHGMEEYIPLRCLRCDTKRSYTKIPDMLKFFAVASPESIMDMQYNLLTSYGMQPDDDMQSRKFLYLHSCHVKDKNEEEERRLAKKAGKK